MTLEQALVILEQTSALANIPKSGHIQAEQALLLIKKALEDKKQD